MPIDPHFLYPRGSGSSDEISNTLSWAQCLHFPWRMSENYNPGSSALPVPPYSTVLLVCNPYLHQRVWPRADVLCFLVPERLGIESTNQLRYRSRCFSKSRLLHWGQIWRREFGRLHFQSPRCGVSSIWVRPLLGCRTQRLVLLSSFNPTRASESYTIINCNTISRFHFGIKLLSVHKSGYSIIIFVSDPSDFFDTSESESQTTDYKCTNSHESRSNEYCGKFSWTNTTKCFIYSRHIK